MIKTRQLIYWEGSFPFSRLHHYSTGFNSWTRSVFGQEEDGHNHFVNPYVDESMAWSDDLTASAWGPEDDFL